jgi:hypothetical protein
VSGWSSPPPVRALRAREDARIRIAAPVSAAQVGFGGAWLGLIQRVEKPSRLSGSGWNMQCRCADSGLGFSFGFNVQFWVSGSGLRFRHSGLSIHTFLGGSGVGHLPPSAADTGLGLTSNAFRLAPPSARPKQSEEEAHRTWRQTACLFGSTLS